MDKKILHKELSYIICGLCFKTHNEMGAFCSERSYADFLEQLFIDNGIPYTREAAIVTSFAGEKTGRNIPDFVVDDTIVVDLKAKKIVTRDDYYQMKRYLTLLKKDLGMIINFRQRLLSPKRILN